MFDYAKVKNALELEAAAGWLRLDSIDDFFPDALNFVDVVNRLPDFLRNRERRILQIDSIACITDHVPKKSGMLREAVYLHPLHRLLYLATLHYLLPKLDRHAPTEVYSYRLDTTERDQYPFPNRADRWKSFQNDFRQACLDDRIKAVLVTDIASFYDHISVDDLTNRILNLLGAAKTDADEEVVKFLNMLLKQWAPCAYGIPQNLDPSSFFASIFLTTCDREIIDKRYKYFRWVDDIRICAHNKKQAIRALHDLQHALLRDRMFLASDKTKIYEKGTPEFDALLDVEDDVNLSAIEDNLTINSHAMVLEAYTLADQRLRIHSEKSGDERKFRAFANRLIDIAAYPQFCTNALKTIEELVLPRLESHPERSDYWTKMLRLCSPSTCNPIIERLLGQEASVYNWQRYYLWRLATDMCETTDTLMTLAKSVINNPISDLEAYQAIIFLGKHGDNIERERLYTQHFSTQRSYPYQRAIVIALQGLDTGVRTKLYERVNNQTREHTELIDYLSSLSTPEYGTKPPRSRILKDEPKQVSIAVKAGVGLIRGEVVRYRLSRGAYDYE